MRTRATKEGASLKLHWTKTISILLFLSLCAGPAPAADREREKLLARQKVLKDRIEALKREQDFLLFQKTLSAQDSKYLVVRITGRTGQLKYKNRVLRDFPVLPQSKRLERVGQGALRLTEKIEGPSKKKFLVFGEALLLTRKGADPAPKAKLPRLVLDPRDFRAIFAALEAGAFLYVVP